MDSKHCWFYFHNRIHPHDNVRKLPPSSEFVLTIARASETVSAITSLVLVQFAFVLSLSSGVSILKQKDHETCGLMERHIGYTRLLQALAITNALAAFVIWCNSIFIIVITLSTRINRIWGYQIVFLV
jgi:hypothetical protein